MLGKERTVCNGRWACIQFLDEGGNLDQCYALNKKGALVNKLKRQPRRSISLQILASTSIPKPVISKDNCNKNNEITTHSQLPSESFPPVITTSLSLQNLPAEVTRSPSLQEPTIDFPVEQLSLSDSTDLHQIPDLCPIELSEIPFPDVLEDAQWEFVDENNGVLDNDL